MLKETKIIIFYVLTKKPALPNYKYLKFIFLTSHNITAHFQNGQILPEGAKDIKCHIERDDKIKTKYTLTAKHNKNVYKGTIGEGYPTDLVNTFIAIRNKTTNKVIFHQNSIINN